MIPGIAALVGATAVVLALGCGVATRFPGRRVATAGAATEETRALAEVLRADVSHLALVVGERNANQRAALDDAEQFLVERVRSMGYQVVREPFVAGGQTFHNLVFERTGAEHPEHIFEVGAHYDSAEGTPGANDNGSGVAALLAIADAFSARSVRHTLRFALYAIEEPPFFNTDDMGSRHHAKASVARGDKVFGMISLETMGHYSDVPGSQNYPAPLGLLYPSEGNFIGFVGDTTSEDLVRRLATAFRAHAEVPSEGASLPGSMPGVYWSDHASWWSVGVPAVMVTDTAPFRYPHYHEPTDTPEHIDYHRLSLVVVGLTRALDAIVRAGPWRG